MGTSSVRPPIEWGAEPAELEEAFAGPKVAIGDELLAALESTGAAIESLPESLAEASRDWWPLAQRWALKGIAPRLPALVVRPDDVGQLAAVLRLANGAGVPVTPAGGRSGVCGGAIPLFGGIALDCRQLAGLYSLDVESLRCEVGAGTFGPVLEEALRQHSVTVGHLPQSMDLATVGGWVACRGAGQYSTRYGKIEDIVAGLEVVLADGRVVRTGALAGAGPRSATGPDLSQLFLGSEGTLGVVTAASLRLHPLASYERRAAFSFPTFSEGLHALRLALAAGACPAVARLYDETETKRSFELDGTNLLIALDEGEPAICDAAMDVLAAKAAERGGEATDEALVARWLERRNDTSALAPLTRAGIVVDTIEVSAHWAALAPLADEVRSLLSAVPGSLAASVHESHAYLDGACLYFTFAGRGPDPEDDAWAASYYRSCWDGAMAACRRHGASISHHHGVGLLRGPYMRGALGEGFAVLAALKAALDPNGILNPGKLGLSSPFGRAGGPLWREG